MKVLVDTSAWVAYFRGSGDLSSMDRLIEENLLVTNNLILSELIPALQHRGEGKLIGILREIERVPLDIDWDDIIGMQVTCLRNGINQVGIPDLIIAQQVIREGLSLLSRDRHFGPLSRHLPLNLH